MPTGNNKRIKCADGFSMSVQASKYNYCEPRIDNASEYTAVEVGYPSNYESMLATWAENPDNYTRTVYPFVPVQVIVDVCAKHGGVVAGDLPPGVIYLRKA
tara:strand:+ start:56 stop:358 length:303 start_codon:yes stop_codon:yes gene_type:complete